MSTNISNNGNANKPPKVQDLIETRIKLHINKGGATKDDFIELQEQLIATYGQEDGFYPKDKIEEYRLPWVGKDRYNAFTRDMSLLQGLIDHFDTLADSGEYDKDKKRLSLDEFKALCAKGSTKGKEEIFDEGDVFAAENEKIIARCKDLKTRPAVLQELNSALSKYETEFLINTKINTKTNKLFTQEKIETMENLLNISEKIEGLLELEQRSLENLTKVRSFPMDQRQLDQVNNDIKELSKNINSLQHASGRLSKSDLNIISQESR